MSYEKYKKMNFEEATAIYDFLFLLDMLRINCDYRMWYDAYPTKDDPNYYVLYLDYK